MSLSAGIPIESIAKMMGHASISSTQVYAQVTDRKISEDMDRLIAKQSAKEKEIAEREGSGLLYKIIKDLYQMISKLSERQVVTDII